MAEVTADAATRIDARGMRCPWPALRLVRAMRDAHAAIIWADDPNFPRELDALATSQGWRTADADALGGAPGWHVTAA